MSHFRKYNIALLVLLVISLSHGLLMAQVTAGSISGHVFDPAGRVIPDAQVKLTNKPDNSVRKVPTDATGRYSFIGLAPSDYIISISAPGFTQVTRSGLSLTVDTDLKLDFSLVVGGPRTRIEVSAPVPSLQTETADQIGRAHV